MEKYDVVLNTKELRKAAFAVGFGLCMGKAVAKSIDMVAWTIFGKSLVRTAEASEIKNSTENLAHCEPENSKEEE